MHEKFTHSDLIKIKPEVEKESLVTSSQYSHMYRDSIANPDDFWAKVAERITWRSKWETVRNISFKKPVHIGWFEGASLNVCENCVDRHAVNTPDRVAIIWEPDNPNLDSKKITYQELLTEVSKFANTLKSIGVKKGDRVSIYMPMVPEAAYAMLACARIGAIHSVVFAGFSPESIRDRMEDCQSHFIITSDLGYRGGKKLELKKSVDQAIKGLSFKPKVLVVTYDHSLFVSSNPQEFCYYTQKKLVSAQCPIEEVASTDPLFILYTSGSTGKPKGVLHGSGGYLVYASYTHQMIFDYKPEDIYWCSADVGWVTGHSYIVYGPLANGATTLMFEGVPNYPNPSRFWQIIDKYQVTIFYTAPTAIRALMREGDEYVHQTSRESLRLLGSVGEPINPEAWLWYHYVVGKGKAPVTDTWWQTETGGILIAPLVGAMDLKPGSATQPFFGVKPKVLSAEGVPLEGPAEGVLVLEDSWPGQMISVYGNHDRFEETYFSTYPGYYFTGDGCKVDEDGYYWITGRVDDVINVSGHRLGSAEIESALVAHDKVAEAAVVGVAHDIKGQGIYAYVTLKNGEAYTDELKRELTNWVRQQIGPIATPEYIHWARGLPKTRSGKIMRRILRKIAEGLGPEELGDTTTLSDPGVISGLIQERSEL